MLWFPNQVWGGKNSGYWSEPSHFLGELLEIRSNLVEVNAVLGL